jgi:ribosomal protein S12 methylthiotransferase accessory factor
MAAATKVGFKRHLRVCPVPGDAVYLIDETGSTALTGSVSATLAVLLDGTRDVAGVLRDAGPEHAPATVADALRRLVDAGLVTAHPDEPAPPDPALAFWDAAGLHGIEVQALLRRAGVRVLAPQDGTALRAAATTTTDALGRCGIATAGAVAAAGTATETAGAGALGVDLTVALCDDYLDPWLAEVDAAQRAAGRPWLPAKVSGRHIWVGPFLTPGEGPCWHCLATRLRARRRAEPGPEAPPAGTPALPVATGSAAHLVALQAAAWIAGYRHPGQRALWTHDSVTLESAHRSVFRRPQCPACGDPGLMSALAEQPVRLHPRRAACRTSGGYRAEHPQTVLERYRPLVDPVIGVVDVLARDERGPRFLNCYRSGPNLALRARTLDGTRSVLRAQSGGKGATALDAETGALCEALERFCSSYHGDEPRRRARYADLGDLAVHPDRCLLVDPRQYTGRAEWNAVHGPLLRIPEPFDEHAETDWSPIWSLSADRHRLLPSSMLYFGAPGPVPGDSNGNAAGTCFEDAVLQGMLELVERDAVALWWYNRARVPGFDLDAFDDPWLDEVRDGHAGMGREMWVLDVTADLDVPVAVAVSRRVDSPHEHIAFGFGAHLDPLIAVRRAVSELNQTMPAMIDPPDDSGDPDLDGWLREATVQGHPYLAPRPGPLVRRRRGPAGAGAPDLEQDVRRLQRGFEEAGMEVLVANLTRPDIGLPVVKVVVPGMRHFWARFAPGRLFDVPVLLGRQTAPTAYEALNPVPLFA